MTRIDELVKIYETFTDKRGPEDCWPWTGSAAPKDGRGLARHKGKTITAPRVSWAVNNGEMPPADKFVCHSCDNPNCVNPAHLWLGTNSDNLRDAAAKGRIYTQRHSDHIKGSKHGNAKLTESDVIALRDEYRAGGITQRALAKKYGMTQGPIREAIKGIGWKHVK